MRRSILAALLCTVLHAETVINGDRSILGAWDASAASSVKPVKTGTTLPEACKQGEVFFKLNGEANRKLYLCSSENVWTQSGYSHGTLAARPSACDAGQIYFATDALAGQNLYFCTTAGSPGSWTQMSGGSAPLSTFGIALDGGGGVIATGHKGYVTVPYACTIVGWSLQADQPGSISIEIDKKASGIPVVTTNSIVAAAPPALNNAQLRIANCNAADCTGWNKAVAANDVFGFQVSSVSLLTRATLVVNCQR
ncbi:MAG TPA: hypothetical protein VG672_21225 [Bryobacteraceae bacterium]|jgi:hypothetical protein|nr:hypothetical protein [Bryobacteraceae bacterium]